MSELPLCPFCEGKGYLVRTEKARIKGKEFKSIFVRCDKCFARTARFIYEDGDMDGRIKAKNDAIAAWSRRVGDSLQKCVQSHTFS